MKEQKIGKKFEAMLVDSVKNKISFFAWNSTGGGLEKSEFKVVAFRKEYGEIELVAKDENEEALQKVISGNRTLNIYVPEHSMSFSSSVKTITLEKKIRIHLPSNYSFYERRKHERIELLDTYYASFEVNKKILKKSIFDLSIGGMAIVLPKSDKIAIAKEKDFLYILLDIMGRKIKLKAECVATMSIDRYKLDNLPYGGYKIAFRFTEMMTKDRNYLIEFIAHQVLLQHIKKAD